MVIRVSDKKKNYSKVTKLLVKPKTISAYRDDEGNKYIKIKTDNDVTFKSFSKNS